MGRMGWRLGRLGRVRRPSLDHLTLDLPADCRAVTGPGLNVATLLPLLLLMHARRSLNHAWLGLQLIGQVHCMTLGAFTVQVPRRLGLGLGPLRPLDSSRNALPTGVALPAWERLSEPFAHGVMDSRTSAGRKCSVQLAHCATAAGALL